MNIEVLQQLRRVVEEAPEDLLHMRAVVEKANCGTARCALGWCIIDPWFQKNTKINGIYPVDYCSSGLTCSPDIEDLVGLSYKDADNLFGGSLAPFIDEHAVSKEEVLWNIDELLAGRHALPYAAVHEPSIPLYAMNIKNARYHDEDEEDDEDDED